MVIPTPTRLRYAEPTVPFVDAGTRADAARSGGAVDEGESRDLFVCAPEGRSVPSALGEPF